MFVYKHTDATECTKKYTTLIEKKIYGKVTQDVLGKKKKNFQGILFISTQTNRQIFMSS